MKEIERKFLVTSLAFLAEATDALHIDQGYLHSTRPTVRVRRRGDQGFLTLKTPSDAKGLVRDEYEYEIPLADAEALLALDNENEEYLLLHADALQGTGRDTEAEEAYLKVREMNPFSMEAMEKLGAFYALHHQLDKALVLYDEAIELQPENAVAYKLRGAVKLQLNDKLGAEDDLKKSLELQPESAKELDGEYSNIENKMEQRYRAQNPFQF